MVKEEHVSTCNVPYSPCKHEEISGYSKTQEPDDDHRRGEVLRHPRHAERRQSVEYDQSAAHSCIRSSNQDLLVPDFAFNPRNALKSGIFVPHLCVSNNLSS
jgi:hypothetical protein